MDVLYPKFSCVLPHIAKHYFHPSSSVCIDILVDKRISEPHFHDFIQIWYTISGSYLHTINGVSKLQSPGSIAVIYPFSEHQINSENSNFKNTIVISVSFKADAFDKSFFPFFLLSHNRAIFDGMYLTPFLNFSDENKQRLDALFIELLCASKKNYETFEHLFFSNIGQVLELCVKTINKPCVEQKLIALCENSLRIQDTVAYITDRNAERISVMDAARYSTMSRSMFMNSFKNVTGKSFHTYLTLIRMRRVVGKLPYEDKAIYEIANAVGFPSNSHFHKVCIDTFSLSPKELKLYLLSYDEDNKDLLINAKDAKKTFDLI